MEIAGESGDSVYLRGFGDYERSSLKLTAAEQAGRRARRLPHVQPRGARAPGRRARGGRRPGHLARRRPRSRPRLRLPRSRRPPLRALLRVRALRGSAGASAGAQEPAAALPGARRRSPPPRSRQLPRRRPGREPRLRSRSNLGLRLTEQIVLDDGTEAGVWLTSGQKSYDITYTRDLTRTRGRLHHIAFFVDQREDVLRAADIFLEHGIVMESGPHKHAIQQTFFLYTYEPGGNRVEVCSGGFLIFAPDHEPVVWSQAERAKGQAWGMQTVAAFHIKGTPPVPEEDALLARAQATEPSRAGARARPRRLRPPRPRRARPREAAHRRPRARPPLRRARPGGLRAQVALRADGGARGRRAGGCAGRPRSGRDRAQRRRRRAERAGGRDRGPRRCADRLAADGRRRERGQRGRPEAGQAAGLARDPGRVRAGRGRERAGAADRERSRERCSTSSCATTSCSRPGISGRAEIHSVVDAALAAGVSRVVVTHPDYPTQGVPVDEQRGSPSGAPCSSAASRRSTPARSRGSDVRGDSRNRAEAATSSRPISARWRTRRSRTGSP